VAVVGGFQSEEVAAAVVIASAVGCAVAVGLVLVQSC